jgi:hypothetical protein
VAAAVSFVPAAAPTPAESQAVTVSSMAAKTIQRLFIVYPSPFWLSGLLSSSVDKWPTDVVSHEAGRVVHIFPFANTLAYLRAIIRTIMQFPENCEAKYRHKKTATIASDRCKIMAVLPHIPMNSCWMKRIMNLDLLSRGT